ncbi:uncharacterized protein LOC107268352 isoform X2 [Cephus cinctus]|nr:uncharacterized protein LOC107268352 isoform X2 [Cephus cinctus]
MLPQLSFNELNAVTNSNGRICSDVIKGPITILNSIVKDIKERVPFNAIFPSERLNLPTSGENSDCDPNITIHVDEFLYNDNDIEELLNAGKLQQYYCKNCGSKNIKSLIYISHSLSQDALHYIFNHLLPILKDKTILDIGSRLGAVLYGAYMYTDAKKIIGVEMNKDFCELQSKIVHKYNMQDRIDILHKRIEDAPDTIKSADVIVLNNVFEFYLSEVEQIQVWQFLRTTMTKGTIVVTKPYIEETLKHLNTVIKINEWLRRIKEPQGSPAPNLFCMPLADEQGKYSDIASYEVL